MANRAAWCPVSHTNTAHVGLWYQRWPDGLSKQKRVAKNPVFLHGVLLRAENIKLRKQKKKAKWKGRKKKDKTKEWENNNKKRKNRKRRKKFRNFLFVAVIISKLFL